ncbi:mCG128385 [Mus musculus]|nr:mCG128385 [Mus musculus]
MFLTGWRHVIYIHFLPGKESAIAYFRGNMNYQYYQLLLLMGRTLRPNPDAERIFKESVMSIMPQTGRIITPPHAGREGFPRPLSPFSSLRLVLWIFLLYTRNHMNSIMFHSSSKFSGFCPSTEACVFVLDPQCTKGVLQYPCRKQEMGPG